MSAYTELQWRWQNRRGEGTAHLFPPRPGPLSTSACGRLKADPAKLEEPLMGLLEPDAPKCRLCLAKDGGA